MFFVFFTTLKKKTHKKPCDLKSPKKANQLVAVRVLRSTNHAWRWETRAEWFNNSHKSVPAKTITLRSYESP